MNKNLLVLLSIATLMILSSNEAIACSCFRSSKPLAKQVKEAKDKSDVVFTGKVLEVTRNPEGGTNVKLEIISYWKGNLSKEITVLTGNDTADCGVPFEVEKTYLVYADYNSSYSSRERLETTICHRTNSLVNARKDIDVLGKRKFSKKN